MYLDKVLTSNRIVWGARISLALIYIWFGGLKLVGGSPAEGFVMELWQVLFSFIEFNTFFIILGIGEVILGVLFLIPRLSLFMLFGIVFHIIGTALPFIFIPNTTWNGPLSFSLEGQYVLKNLTTLFLTIWIWKHHTSQTADK